MPERLDKLAETGISWPKAARNAENLHMREMDGLRNANVSCILTSGRAPLPDNTPHVLFVTETKGDHFSKTFAVAAAAGRQINEIGPERFTGTFNKTTAKEPRTLEDVRKEIHEDYARMTMVQGGPDPLIKPAKDNGNIFAMPQQELGEDLLKANPQRDILLKDQRTILSLSYNNTLESTMNPSRAIDPNNNLKYNDWNERSYKATVFVSAGNLFDKISEPKASDTNATRGLTGRNIEVVMPEGHTINGIIVGAADIYKSQNTELFRIAEYSSPGADILMPVSYMDGNELDGTSYSTPALAAVYKEIAEAYGDRLSPVEMRLAMYMSTDLDILNNDTYIRDKSNPELVSGDWATFRINDGGRPWHPRAGAGMLDIGRWRENLEKMVTLKQGQEHQFEHLDVSVKMKFAGTRPVAGENADAYVYEAEVPQGMTLDKITVQIANESNLTNEIQIESPSGFSAVIPQSGVDHIVSTTALALEDVKTGDKIRIISPHPLDVESLYMDIRGLENNDVDQANAVQQLREYRFIQNHLPARMSEYQNTGKPVPDTHNLKADYNPAGPGFD